MMTYPAPTGPAARAGAVGNRPARAMAVGAVIALIFSTFGYYSIGFTDRISAELCDRSDLPGSVRRICQGDSRSAWHGFLGWFGVVVLLCAGLLAALPLFRPHAASRMPVQLLTAVAAGAGLVCTVVALVVTPGGDPADLLPRSGMSESEIYRVGHGPSYWAILVIAAAMTSIALAPMVQARRGGRRSRRAAPTGRAAPRVPAAPYAPSSVAPPSFSPSSGLDQAQGYQPGGSDAQVYLGPPPMIAPPEHQPPRYPRG